MSTLSLSVPISSGWEAADCSQYSHVPPDNSVWSSVLKQTSTAFMSYQWPSLHYTCVPVNLQVQLFIL